MHDSSMAHSQIQNEAIHRSIREGKTTVQELHAVLLEEITQELNQPIKEVDIAYINACEVFLDEINRNRSASVSTHYEHNLQAIHRKIRPFSIMQNGRRRLVTALCLVLVILTTSLLTPGFRIISHQTEDEGQYIMQGIETPAGFVSIAEAGPAIDRIGTYTVTEWQAVVQLMGGTPVVPQWMPTGWSILDYNITLTSTSSSLVIAYCGERTTERIVFQSTTYFDPTVLHRYVEQNGTGTISTLANGTSIYIASNTSRLSAVWNDASSIFMLSGDIDQAELIHIITSVE